MTNRVLKFRAWDKKKRQWLTPYSTQYLCVGYDTVVVVEYAPAPGGTWEPDVVRQLTNDQMKDLEIMQFTGLLDKNGVEIYEGDIIRESFGVGYSSVQYPSFKDGTERISVYPVEWAEAYWGYLNLALPRDNNFSKTFEVIGNIHQSPELLK